MVSARADGPSRVDFLLAAKFSMMAFAAAVEPLRVANRLAGRNLYGWRILTIDGAPVAASNGMSLIADGRLDGAADLPRLVVCAGFEPQLHYDRALRAALRRVARAGGDLGPAASSSPGPGCSTGIGRRRIGKASTASESSSRACRRRRPSSRWTATALPAPAGPRPST